MDSGLTYRALLDMLTQVEASMAPPWEMLRGEARLQISDYAPAGQLYVVDTAAGLMLDLPGDDRRKMVLCSRPTADAALALLREAWPSIARLSREKQETELAAFYLWKAMQSKDGKPGMRL